ncbi:hypothetical protein LO762_22505 [Actinocorallia sp. API 0066]|uniref:hypothetical protein n=1 Tax=Actinocorallia sp. API 0066 TaxID=2896846 RepID=UPI001E5E7C94|nr:hypothetical protein [Actinocorallia sp. API 0066]MCD0451944.1 hypothetical protein [Actinocorallia sp. API 0066]
MSGLLPEDARFVWHAYLCAVLRLNEPWVDAPFLAPAERQRACAQVTQARFQLTQLSMERAGAYASPVPAGDIRPLER